MMGLMKEECTMTYAKTALALLRFGIGLYLIFIAGSRLLGYQATGSFQALYSSLFGGSGAVESGNAIAIGASIFLGLLGLVLISGRLLVVAGILVTLVGLASGVGEFIAAQTPGLMRTQAFTMIANGVRDILVLAMTGGAIAALDSYIRHRRYQDARARRAGGVAMYREGVPVGTTASGRTILSDRPEDPHRPLR